MDEFPYLIPFPETKKRIRVVSDRGQLKITMGYEAFLTIVRELLIDTPVDEEFYNSAYSDVAAAVAAGTHGSVKQHSIENGYNEGRLPFAMRVNQNWYADQNPDLVKGLKVGRSRYWTSNS